MENIESIKSRLRKEGYGIIHEYTDSPNEEFPDHDHPGDQLLVVVKGSIAVKMNGKDYSLKAGHELRFPAKMVHSAKAGPEGCGYIVGEKG